jgi:hypothetical protein
MKIVVTRDFNVAADCVWNILEDFGNMSWLNMAEISIQVIGEGIGMVRRVSLDGQYIDERLESINKKCQSLTYSIEECELFPFKNYLAEMKVESIGQNKCKMTWMSDFDECKMIKEEAEKMMLFNYNTMLDSLADHVES